MALEGLAKLLSTFGMVAGVAGTLTSTYGAFKGAKAEQQAARYQETTSRNNAQLAEWEAQDALERGAEAEQRHRLKVAAFKGSQRANIASRGIALDEGSPLRLLTDTDFLGELDAQMIRSNAEKEAYTRRTEAQQYTSDAEFARYSRKSISPTARAGATLLTGAGTVADKWLQYKAID